MSTTSPLDEISDAAEAPERTLTEDEARAKADAKLAEHFVLKGKAYRPKVKRIRLV